MSLPDHIEAPGCCPMCGKGKLIVVDFECHANLSGPSHTDAKMICNWRLCRALVSVAADRYATALRDAVLDGYESRQAKNFRETIGGFQFTD